MLAARPRPCPLGDAFPFFVHDDIPGRAAGHRRHEDRVGEGPRPADDRGPSVPPDGGGSHGPRYGAEGGFLCQPRPGACDPASRRGGPPSQRDQPGLGEPPGRKPDRHAGHGRVGPLVAGGQGPVHQGICRPEGETDRCAVPGLPAGFPEPRAPGIRKVEPGQGRHHQLRSLRPERPEAPGRSTGRRGPSRAPGHDRREKERPPAAGGVLPGVGAAHRRGRAVAAGEPVRDRGLCARPHRLARLTDQRVELGKPAGVDGPDHGCRAVRGEARWSIRRSWRKPRAIRCSPFLPRRRTRRGS